MINVRIRAGYVALREEHRVAIRSLNAQNSADVVMERVGPGVKETSVAFPNSLVRHLHAIVCETRPTKDQWRFAMQLLTDIGHATDDRRQEMGVGFRFARCHRPCRGDQRTASQGSNAQYGARAILSPGRTRHRQWWIDLARWRWRGAFGSRSSRRPRRRGHPGRHC